MLEKTTAVDPIASTAINSKILDGVISSLNPRKDTNTCPEKQDITSLIARDLEKAGEPYCRRFRLDPKKKPPKPDFLLYIGGVGVVVRSELCVISGLPKSGKSTFLRAMIASSLTGEPCLNVSCDRPLKVALLDTEQSEADACRVFTYFTTFTGKDIDEYPFDLMWTRTATIEERIKVMESMIVDLRPDILYIDGIADMVADTNDLVESQTVVDKVLSLASEYRVSLVVVIHTNHGNGPQKLRGHLGSGLERKCSYGILIKSSSSGGDFRATVCPRNPRYKCFREFDFGYCPDGEGLCLLGDTRATPTKERTVSRSIAETIKDNMERGREYTPSEIGDLAESLGYKRNSGLCDMRRNAEHYGIRRIGNNYVVPNPEEQVLFDD